ncbi:MAG: protoporphyrinogen oxidase [Actinomycetia bacterium]|nr:protoporphyrinogen oxidase [Actinomycetes bacterium]
MPELAVVGAGIAGLAAARRLVERAPAGTVVHVFEANARAGGAIRSEITAGVVLEAGPDSLLTRKPAAVELCRALGLADELIGPAPGARGADIFWAGRLHPIPPGLMAGVPSRPETLWRSGLLSWSAKLRALADLWRPPKPTEPDASLGELLAYRFGPQVVDRLVAPLLAGIYAGDIRTLSLKATFPQLAAWQDQYGSLIRAARRQPPPAGHRGPPFLTLRTGLERMVRVLVEKTSATWHFGEPVRRVVPEGGGFRLETDRGRYAVDGLVLATPAPRTREMLGEAVPEAGALLAEIPYTDLAVVGLLFRPAAFSPPRDKTGVLVPAGQGLALTAVTFVGSKWAYPEPPPYEAVRVFLGRAGDAGLLEHDDDALVARARAELERVLGVRAEPETARVFRHPAGMPQYRVGHLDRVARLEQVLARWPQLRLAGQAYHGVGIPDNVADGHRAADAVLAAVGAAVPVALGTRGDGA